PVVVDTALRWAGIARGPARAPFRMLDIGCGDGVSLALIAASHPEAEIWGFDAMPEAIATGQNFAQPAGVPLTLVVETFETALARDWPLFDLISCQGVISWVSPENRARVMRLVGRLLAPGGAFVVGYNAMPGWSNRIALQQMLHRWAMGLPGTPAERFQAALERLVEMQAAGVLALPEKELANLVQMQKHLPPDYFPHEYLNEHWQPLWSLDVKRALAAEGLAFAAQTRFIRFREDYALRKAQRAALTDRDPALRDAEIDAFTHTGFRVDIYTRDAVLGDRAETRGQAWFAANKRPDDASYECRTPAGRLTFDNDAARAVMRALEDGPRRWGDLVAACDQPLEDLDEAVDALLISQLIQPAAPPAETPRSEALNAQLIRAASAGAGGLNGLVGRHGPVRVSRADLALLAAPATEIVARARRDPAYAARIFEPDLDLASDDALAHTTDAHRDLRAALRRVGVTV
ncbi:MAG: class I SAM-dependent methyltransferase, partial [Pseudomonadota bacterium]